jgi:hypothetical protein
MQFTMTWRDAAITVVIGLLVLVIWNYTPCVVE